MKELFSLDLKNYNPDGPEAVRNSARGIIYKDGKVLLIHSKTKGYYKFPGGGIEKGESNTDALIREVREETGYSVKPESIEEYGFVLRRQKDSYNENGFFSQTNFYYFCEIEDFKAETKLDDYEKEDGFETVWMNPVIASGKNRYEVDTSKTDVIMVKRESKVLDLVDLEIRKRERNSRELRFLESLGNPEYLEMLSYVENELRENSESGAAKSDIKYNRYEHTRRVLKWTLKLYELSPDKDKLRYEDLIIATIFHDVGRVAADKNGMSHAHAGVPLTRDYLKEKGYSEERTEFICRLVEKHSDKNEMCKEMEPNLLLLMEADLLDDMGALGVVMDCMIVENRNNDAVFTDCLDHIKRYTQRIQHDNPMITDEGRMLWDNKTKLVDDFVSALQDDLELFLY